MSIKETKKKLYISFAVLNTSKVEDTEPVYARVTMKNKTITFGNQAVTEMGMNNKFVKFGYDSGRNILAWKIVEGLENDEFLKKTHRLVKLNANKQAVVSISAYLNQFKGLKQEKYKCEIKKYVETNLHQKETYYYIQLA